jgi:tetratricopeptide (TPR) repeat protein
MDAAELLQQALEAARAGRDLTARDLFQDVVRLDPNNETAWLWLSGLLDPLEDRIMACERVLSINPGNHQVRAYLKQLIEEQQAAHQKKTSELDEKVQQVRWLIEEGRREEALQFLQVILREDDSRKDAWQLFADLSIGINDKVRAYAAIVQHHPSDEEARALLKRFKYYQRNPLELAAYYEEEGEQDKALELYRSLAARAGDSSEFDRIYKNISRIKYLQRKKIRYVRPSFNILRLSTGLPLLYAFEILIQEGLNPIRHPAPHLWIGLPMVAVGGFLLAVSGVRSRHVIWQRWFGEFEGRGSTAARILVSIAGWFLVLAPHLLLALDSVVRMQTFETPTIPWIRLQ